MIIRRYQTKDKESLRKICVATASPAFQSNREMQEAVCLMYNDYYTEQEPESVFVACGDEDKPFGYILCSQDFAKFAKVMSEKYLPRLSVILPDAVAPFEHYIEANGMISSLYPAHLHIDILPGYQRQGVGHKLMDALVADLSKRHVSGVYLICDENNVKGCSFYRDYGFMEIAHEQGSFVFALPIATTTK